MASSLLKQGKKGISAVIALAAEHGKPRQMASKSMDVPEAVSPTSEDRKSIRIEKILNGYKVIWSPTGSYRDQEAHAPTWGKAFKIAGAYMNGTGSDTTEKQEDET